jgi:hypothetical protein
MPFYLVITTTHPIHLNYEALIALQEDCLYLQRCHIFNFWILRVEVQKRIIPREQLVSLRRGPNSEVSQSWWARENLDPGVILKSIIRFCCPSPIRPWCDSEKYH